MQTFVRLQNVSAENRHTGECFHACIKSFFLIFCCAFAAYPGTVENAGWLHY